MHYDVAVIGAGPAGSAAAYVLARDGLRVALLDKFDFPRDKTCGDGLTPRAVEALHTLGILPTIEKSAYCCTTLTVRNSDEVTFQIDLSGPKAPQRRILILPRLSLDEILLQHAIQAGAQFIPDTKVENIIQENGHIRLSVEGSQSLDCIFAVIAIGANTGLLRKAGLMKGPPPPNLAARAYFENVDGLDNTVMLFFDGVERPGYGWIFPTSPTTANIGCGVFFDSYTPQPTHLRHLIQSHPHLQRILRNARQVGPIKGHPLRTDFSGFLSGKGRILVTGEAVGLVHPISGEGIDYALESGQRAAEAILEGWQHGSSPQTIQKKYRAALSRNYNSIFRIANFLQRFFFRDGIVDKGLFRIHHRPYLQHAVVDYFFGEANPISVFTPKTIWDILKPWD
jgi:geranylgeranyl reductase family protein